MDDFDHFDFYDLKQINITVVMFNFEIAISNLNPRTFLAKPQEQLTFRFGSINTVIPICEGFGGKSLILDLSIDEFQSMRSLYALGMFIKNDKGKFFCLVSLEQFDFENGIECQEVYFYDSRQSICYDCQLTVSTKPFKNPRVPKQVKRVQAQQNINLLKKPPVPQQQKNTPKIDSFLMGNQQNNLKKQADQIKQQRKIISKLQHSQSKPRTNSKEKISVRNTNLEKQTQMIDDEWELQNSPPIMCFTNLQEEVSVFQVPKIKKVVTFTQQSSKQIIQNSEDPQYRTPSQKQTATFNRNKKEASISEQNLTEFSIKKPIAKNLSRKQVMDLAKEEANKVPIKENIKIPIVKGDSFQLVPLSELNPQQIIDYVHSRKEVQEQGIHNQNQKRKLEQKQRQIEQKNRKLLQQLERKEKEGKRQSSMSKRRESINKSIQQVYDEQSQAPSEDYGSDFQSMSVSGSNIRSRISSRGNPRIDNRQQSSAYYEDDYDQQFESYSQSVLSKTNHKKKDNSQYDYSESWRSISQSQRK